MTKKVTKESDSLIDPVVEDTTEELSKEELAERRKEITDYYKEKIKHLKIQLEYEELLMNIEKTRAERIQAQMFLQQSMMPPDGQPNEQPDGQPDGQQMKDFAMAQGADFDVDKKRTLKRTK